MDLRTLHQIEANVVFVAQLGEKMEGDITPEFVISPWWECDPSMDLNAHAIAFGLRLCEAEGIGEVRVSYRDFRKTE